MTATYKPELRREIEKRCSFDPDDDEQMAMAKKIAEESQE
jgi:hypothetical protein